MKTCTKCGEAKEFSEFYKEERKKDGYLNCCKQCIKQQRQKRAKNPVAQLEKAITSSVLIENKMLFKEGKRLCGSCRNIFLITEMKDYYCEKCSYIEFKKYREENREKIKESKRRYREEKEDKIKGYFKEYAKEYLEKNREKINEQRRQRYHKQKEGN